MNQVKLRVEEGPNGKRFFLGDDYPGVYLTVREAELAQLVVEHKYHEIADLMGISCRTIEYYTMNIKKKLRCQHKRELIYIICESGLLEQLKEHVDINHIYEEADQRKENNTEQPGEETESLDLQSESDEIIHDPEYDKII